MIIQQPTALNTFCTCHLRGYRFIVTRVINNTNMMAFTPWFIAWLHLMQSTWSLHWGHVSSTTVVWESNILPTKMLPWRFISSESPDQEPNHQTMVLTMSLDSQLLTVSRELQKKTCSQAGFYVFSLQKRIAASPLTSIYTTVLPLHTKTGPVYQSMARWNLREVLPLQPVCRNTTTVSHSPAAAGGCPSICVQQWESHG